MKKIVYIFYAGLFFIIPFKLFAEQAPGLGAASGFAIFTSSGPVNDTGQSRITGNIGTNNGIITGFGNIYGVIHNANENTINAANDLLLTYNFLNTAIPEYFIGPRIGNGDTLKAGVYRSTGVTTLKQNLYFDAEGDTNAVFIIQINGAFSSVSNAKVKLLNGAQVSKVFWKVEGPVNLGPGTFIRGNIIANKGDIILSLNDTLEGRALTTKGSVYVNKLVTFGDHLDIPTVPLDGGLWVLLGFGIMYAGIRFKKRKKVQPVGNNKL